MLSCTTVLHLPLVSKLLSVIGDPDIVTVVPWEDIVSFCTVHKPNVKNDNVSEKRVSHFVPCSILGDDNRAKNIELYLVPIQAIVPHLLLYSSIVSHIPWEYKPKKIIILTDGIPLLIIYFSLMTYKHSGVN